MPFLIAKWPFFVSLTSKLFAKLSNCQSSPQLIFILRKVLLLSGFTSIVAAYPLSLTKGGFNQLPNFAVNVFSENFPLTIDNLRLITLCERNLKFAQPSKIACLYVSKVISSKQKNIQVPKNKKSYVSNRNDINLQYRQL